METVLEEDAESAISIQELENFLLEIDRNGCVESGYIDDPGEFLLKIYRLWQKKGGLKERGKNRNSQNQLKKWLIDPFYIKSLQYKLQGIRSLNENDVRVLITIFLRKWNYQGRDDEKGEPIYRSLEGCDVENIVSILVESLFLEKSEIKISGGKEYIEDESNIELMQKRVVSEIYNESKAIFVLSINNTIIGKEPAISSGGFNRFFNMYFEEDKKRNEYFEPLHIWIVDMGARIDGDIASLEAFSNVCILASKLTTFSNFDGFSDSLRYGERNIFERMTGFDPSIRRARWSWLAKKSVIIVKNLREEEISSLDMRFRFSGEIHRVPNVSESHVLPNSTPNLWVDDLRSLYGSDFRIEDATLSVALRKSHGEPNDPVEYQAYARIPKYKNSEEAVIKSIRLPSPGESYETAIRLAFQAAKCVLRDDVGQRSQREETALRYLHLLGFYPLRVDQFIRTVMAVPRNEDDQTMQ